MSLATRCPSCGTVFRVVQDQLRVSEGWVRCGRCNGVFNASEVLFDIDSGAPVLVDLGLPGSTTAATGPTPAPARPAEAPGTQAGGDGLPPRDGGAAAVVPEGPSWPAAPAATTWPGTRVEPHFDPAPAWAGPPVDGTQRADDEPTALDGPLLRAPSRDDDAAPAADRLDDIVITDHVPAAPPVALRTVDEAADAPASDDGPATAAPAPGAAPVSPVQALPSFLRTAERTAPWHRPAMRVALALGVVVLAVALLVQAALLWRDPLAAHWPASAPALQALCQVAGCRVEPLRRIEALSVHSSGLNRLEGSPHYRLQVVLHNRADLPVMMPALELTLADGPATLVARRVLQGAELGVPQAVLQPGEELPIKALLSTGGRRVDGYTLELFYP